MTTDQLAAQDLTGAVLGQVRALPLDDLPAHAATVARSCLLDWAACAVAGSGEPLTDLLAAELAPTDTGEATLVGRPGRAPAALAALVNGAAGHALDYDDTHLAMSGHPTAPVAPAVLALGERVGADGAALLAALIAGVEAECRLGLVVNPSHYEAGWHATGTLGTVGAAVACGHLLGLDDERLAHAVGLAATQASGLKAVFGTMAKPFHAGRAASSGLLAATVAAGGFTAGADVLGAPQGFAATHADEPPAAAGERLAAAAGRFLVRDTLFKHHAACYLTHAAIEAARQLRPALPAPDHVTAVEVAVHPSCLKVCAIPEPRTGLEGKFSLRATTAMALLGDDTSAPGAYTDARMAAPDLVALRDRVEVVPTGAVPPTAARVAVATADGRRAETTVDTGVPAADLENQQQRLTAKFRALTAPVLGERKAEVALAAIVGPGGPTSPAELLGALRP